MEREIMSLSLNLKWVFLVVPAVYTWNDKKARIKKMISSCRFHEIWHIILVGGGTKSTSISSKEICIKGST